VGTRLTRYHLEAGVACEHAIATSVETTDWARIVTLYDELSAMVKSPITALNRALAIAEFRGLDRSREARQDFLRIDRRARPVFVRSFVLVVAHH
jgi:predicted RNA polymerase sigma factor